MEIGKVPSDILKEIIFSNIRHQRPEVLVRPNIGEDCAVVDFGEYLCVVSSDPITGASKDIGSLAIHISCNDVASNGVEPLGIMMTILAPPSTTKEVLSQVMQEANRAAASVNVEIMGGHTEITNAVNRMVISTTAIGRKNKDGVVFSKGAQVGDAIIMTKHAGLEGIAIIAKELEDQLRESLEEEEIKRAQGFGESISVVKEGVLAGKQGVRSMHDVTEGGILGALWEIAEVSGVGIEINQSSIPLREETQKICDLLSINPLRLISSGVMVMTVGQDKKEELIRTLIEADIEITEIGKITRLEEGRYLINGQGRQEIEPPGPDELYKVI